MEKIKSLGGEVIYPVELVHPKQTGIGKAMDTIFGRSQIGKTEELLITGQTTSPVVLLPHISERETIQP